MRWVLTDKLLKMMRLTGQRHFFKAIEVDFLKFLSTKVLVRRISSSYRKNKTLICLEKFFCAIGVEIRARDAFIYFALGTSWANLAEIQRLITIEMPQIT